MNVYAFDVDQTLEISDGPILMKSVIDLHNEGHAVGICGNWGRACQTYIAWHYLFSFIGPMSVHGIALPKANFLIELKTYIPADDYIMVGNDPKLFGLSQDRVQAELATWRFVREYDFAGGER